MMSEQDAELKIIQDLSTRIVDAQKNIRILDSIKWDEQVYQQFFAKNGKQMPEVDEQYYQKRPLPFDPLEKIDEFRLILRDAHNQLGQYSPVTRLMKRQCDEYMRSVTMLAARGTSTFSKLAMELYGSPDDVFYAGGPRLSEMGADLFEVLTALEVKLQSAADEKQYTAFEAQEILQSRLSTFFNRHPGKVAVVVTDDMVADAAAGADSIKLSSRVMFSDHDLKYLEVHEGWVHVGTTLNGAMQPYCFFLSKGSPGSSVIQEGLAVVTEVVTFATYPSRMRRITNRVIALDKVTQGANFLDIYNYFLECGSTEEESYRQTVRVFRGSTPTGGPFTKDLCYAKGFVLIHNFIRYAISLHRVEAIPLLFAGKLVLDDLPLLLELKDQGLLAEPVYLPPQFRDLSALSAWVSFSLYLNKFSMQDIQKAFRFILA